MCQDDANVIRMRTLAIEPPHDVEAAQPNGLIRGHPVEHSYGRGGGGAEAGQVGPLLGDGIELVQVSKK